MFPFENDSREERDATYITRAAFVAWAHLRGWICVRTTKDVADYITAEGRRIVIVLDGDGKSVQVFADGSH